MQATIMRTNQWVVTSEFLTATRTQWQTIERFIEFHREQVAELNGIDNAMYHVIFN